MIDLPVGTVFNYNGYREDAELIVTDESVDPENCDGCIFDTDELTWNPAEFCNSIVCDGKLRKDGKHVIFKRRKNEV